MRRTGVRNLGFLLTLLLLIPWRSDAAAGLPQDQQKALLKAQVSFSAMMAEPGENIQVIIQLDNNLGHAISELALYDPEERELESFGTLEDGGRVEWRGTWIVTDKQLEAGKISFFVRYREGDEGEKGSRRKVVYSKKIVRTDSTPVPTMSPAPTVTPGPRPEDLPRVILCSLLETEPTGKEIRICCLDEAGALWDSGPMERTGTPVDEEELLAIVTSRRGMKIYDDDLDMAIFPGDLTEQARDPGTTYREILRDLSAMADFVPAQAGEPRETAHQKAREAVYAVRENREAGRTEAILLGLAGSRVWENTDAGAQTLYRFMWRQLRRMETLWPSFEYGSEYTPQGYQAVSVKDFFHLPDIDTDKVTVEALNMDCEAGPIPVPLSEKKEEKILRMAQLGTVIGKRSPWMVTGGTMVYVFRDAAGNVLGQIETYEEDTLAVGKDGMYALSLRSDSYDSQDEEAGDRLVRDESP